MSSPKVSGEAGKEEAGPSRAAELAGSDADGQVSRHRAEVDSSLEHGASGKSSPAPWAIDAPDGGLVAWLVVLGAWCTSFCSFGWINSIGIFQEYYSTELLNTYSSATIAWIPSLQLFFMMASGPLVGRAFDSYGPRHIVLVGSFLHVFGLMMASISTKYYQILLSQGVCSAIGVACTFQPSLNCIMGWFGKNRGKAYGLMATGSSLGGIVFPIMVDRLIHEVGFGWAMRVSGFLILFLLAIANLTVRARHAPRPGSLTQEQMVTPFREPGFVLLMLGMSLLTFGIYVPINYLPSQAIEAGIDKELAQYLIAILNAGSLFGRLMAGFVSDALGKYNTFVASCYVTAILTLAFWIPAATQSAVIAFAVLYGFFSGAYVSLIGALVAQVSPLPEIGFRTGLIFLVLSVPGLVTNPIAGAIFLHCGGWTAVKVYTGVFITAGTTIILAARVAWAGPKLLVVF
ncbi:hypothetical protein P8C59_008672 [Phyllachora maydis]|uniref:Major facilitator superfamily (MFS) profile domain-containing protein n=1 Tax=Phyllachora maydis TaxID=1825666 RepID=A0AAD9IC90_9PEZI|nr:hypothetical protein P8C59_008672 [Phyllachora maydis]